MFKNICLFIFAFLGFIPFHTFAQQNNATIVSSLDKVIRPIETLKGDTNFNDIDFLKETLKDKEVIALGEVTHGTAEVFDYKDRLARFLVTNLGYKAIAFEGDYIAMEYFDKYITGKVDTIKYVGGTAIAMTNYPLIEWLRKYNVDKLETEKVHVYGLEVRSFTNILSKILGTFPNLDQGEKDLMSAYLTKPYNSQITKAETKGIERMVSKFKNLRLSDIDRQYLDMLNQLTHTEKEKGYRDSYMAKNAGWIKERAKGGKLIVWAHNGHVKKTESYHYPTLGTQLHRNFGAKYYVIGTDFNSGTGYVNVYVARNKPTLGFKAYNYAAVDSDMWYEYFFNQCKYKNFILDIKKASLNPILKSFMENPLKMRSIGALSIPEGEKLSLSKSFDLIVYFDKAHSI